MLVEYKPFEPAFYHTDIADWGMALLHARAAGPKAKVPVDTGQRICYDYGGGGGWGDPLQRDPQAVLDDVFDEYVSVEGARRDYGVVLTGSFDDLTLAVDEAATAALRRSLSAQVP